ncbi:hypothetical protein NT017_00080 [Prolixibacter sp. NT017]|nr:hypothetical protein NT017_00080 [Prolixibacter sp. NT017]
MLYLWLRITILSLVISSGLTPDIGLYAPQTLTEKLSISRCRFYVAAQNAITLTGYSGYNPELPGQISRISGNSDNGANTTNSGTLNSGIDLSSYPETASYLLGLNITF